MCLNLFPIDISGLLDIADIILLFEKVNTLSL